MLELQIKIDELKRQLLKYGGGFGRGKFYQSLEGVVDSADAQRPTTERLESYHVLDVIDGNSKVLDIGSNCGFVSLTVAKKANNVLGIEASSELINISNIAKEITEQTNCEFKKIKFNDFNTTERYDVILALAVHGWVRMTFRSFVDKVVGLMTEDSYLMFESHDINKVRYDLDIDVKVNYLLEHFEIIHTDLIKDDKAISRKFYLMKRKLIKSK